MSLLPSSNFTTMATGEIFQQFLFFSRPIKIYKEPAQTINSEPTSLLYGYPPDSQSNNTQITYNSESQIFSGLIIYPFKNRNNQNQMFDNKIILNNNSTYVKLTREGKDYIQNGTKNEKIEFDGQTWNFNDSMKYQTQTFLNLQFYYFEVKGTN